LLVVEMIAMTTPAMRSAMEHESAATTHIGGRRRKRCAVIVRLSCARDIVGCIRLPGMPGRARKSLGPDGTAPTRGNPVTAL
jgi:hypothetical protein